MAQSLYPGNSTEISKTAIAVDISVADHVFATVIRYLWIGTAGNLSVITVNGQTIAYKAVPIGLFNLVQITAIKVTAEGAAGDIVAHP
jgi:hypothetical protein